MKHIHYYFLTIFICPIMLSCVKKSDYESLEYDYYQLKNELESCKSNISTYERAIAEKDDIISQLSQQVNSLNSASSFDNSNFSSDKDKYKAEFERIEYSLDKTINNLASVEDASDINSIIQDTKRLKDDISTFVFFNF